MKILNESSTGAYSANRNTGSIRTMRDTASAVSQIHFGCNDPSKLAESRSAATGSQTVTDYGAFVMADSTPGNEFYLVSPDA